MDSDTLSQGDELRDPRFLTSANKIFSLQFFSPGTSKNRYVGIFYQSLDTRHTDCHPVWVANRNNPLPDASGILMITDSVEVNPDGSINRTLWQSFDFPTDTILPGMKLGINFRTGHKWSLTSWVSDDVPASGSLTLSGDPNGSSQLIMWWQRNPYWISGLWQYGRFDNSPWLTNVYGLDYSYISNENESYLTYSVDYHEKIVKLSINTTGWISVTGVAGVTDFNLCPFSATSTAGCVNWMLPECRNSKHQFIGSRGFAYGHSYTFNKNYNMSIFDCGLECEHNCSCIAYASIFENGTGCKIWTNDTTFTFSETLIGENVYIFQTENASVSIIHTGRDTAKKGWILPVASAGGALLVLSFLLFCILRRFRTKAAEEVLLHTIRTREKCSTADDIENDMSQAWELWIEGRALELMDTTLERTNQENEVTRTITVGLLCVQDSAADRPSMSDVFPC
ncbi:hypothetical protein BUALT_Bualt07G0141500 [Buddleja alternifolia]|uniref:Uncharacterized protein n=1 Tax=Buddleja alternifolia TaxID=168488 RepID=A0AAV6XHD3_9LAMI|nr:hypothetical protein BUALT_Bualt07G0141500 [Buddleja alternifolia]